MRASSRMLPRRSPANCDLNTAWDIPHLCGATTIVTCGLRLGAPMQRTSPCVRRRDTRRSNSRNHTQAVRAGREPPSLLSLKKILAHLLAVEWGGGKRVKHTGKRLNATDKVRPRGRRSSKSQVRRLNPFMGVRSPADLGALHVKMMDRRANPQVKDVGIVLSNRTAQFHGHGAVSTIHLDDIPLSRVGTGDLYLRNFFRRLICHD